MLQVCLNGGRTRLESRHVPLSPTELARDAIAVRGAGADELHVHPRNRAEAESLAPQDVARCLTAIRSAVPGMPVGIGTGAWIEPKLDARLDHIREWNVLPNYASVNLSEDGAPETMNILQSKSIGIEVGLWTAMDAQRFANLRNYDQCLRILIEMITDDPVEAELEYREIVSVLEMERIRLPILLHGDGGNAWPMVTLARENGHDTRVGMEDCLLLPDGRPAESNRSMVEAAVHLLG